MNVALNGTDVSSGGPNVCLGGTDSRPYGIEARRRETGALAEKPWKWGGASFSVDGGHVVQLDRDYAIILAGTGRCAR